MSVHIMVAENIHNGSDDPQKGLMAHVPCCVYHRISSRALIVGFNVFLKEQVTGRFNIMALAGPK